MIRLAVTQAAFDAICATLPLKVVAFEGEVTAKGGRSGWTMLFCGVSLRCAAPARA
jgi:hypothetical protein